MLRRAYVRESLLRGWCRGQAQHGELGYGPKGKKSSANPDKCHALEGITTHQARAYCTNHPGGTDAYST